MSKQVIQVGHSPDSDDAFMFYALAKGKLDTGPFEFRHVLQDIETLNQRAQRRELELTAVSVHGYAYVADAYALLNSGASIGDGYGPMMVAREPFTLASLKGRTIAVPGTRTSAFLALRLAAGDFRYEVVPFDQILDAVHTGRVDAGLIIHEGQLTYGERGLKLIVDLGRWWQEETGLPLPLGVNAVRRDLGPSAIREIARLMKASIQFALDHREAALEYALQFGRDLNRTQADRFVGMYVNHWTLDLGERGRRAVQLFLNRGHEAGVIPSAIDVEFVDA